MKKIIPLLIFAFSSQLFAAEVTYEYQGKPYEGYFLKGQEKLPLVILIHDWDGLTEYEVKRSKMLQDLGYSVFAADLFGKGIRPEKVEDRRQHTGELYKDREKMRGLMEAALTAARKNGLNSKKVVVMGYCFGGAAVLEWARSGKDLQGFVTFHGGLASPEGQGYKKTKGKVLVFHGTSDSNITMQDFASLAVNLDQNKIKHELVTYGGAPHAFTVFGSESYRKDADEHSWNRYLEFLKEI